MRAVLRLIAGLVLNVPVWALGRAYTKLCYGSLG